MSNIREMDVQRRMVAYKTTQAWNEIPHVSFIYEPDITDFYHLFLELREKFRQEKESLSINTIMLKAVVEGLKKAPALNARLTYEAGNSSGKMEILDEISVDIPWLLPDGKMITLTAFDLKEKTLREISSQIADMHGKVEKTDFDLLLKAAVTGKTDALAEDGFFPKDVAEGSVTVSNLGSICQVSGSVALLEILPPQVFAIGISAIQEKPGVFVGSMGEKEIGIRKYIPMCLAFDHRAFDFGDIVPFIRRLDGIFQKPAEIFSW